MPGWQESHRASRDARSFRDFKARIQGFGGTVLEPTWLGLRERHRVRCSNGHETAVTPNGSRGPSFCVPCAAIEREAVVRRFHDWVADLGGTVMETEWLGSQAPHRVCCSAGHEVMVKPKHSNRAGICNTCIDDAKAVDWRRFCERVSELGGSVLEPAWLGFNTRPHRVRCKAGHETTSSPSALLVMQQPLCGRCVRRDTNDVWKHFKEIAISQSGTVLEGRYLGAGAPHRVRCRAGHEFSVNPSAWLRHVPRDICQECARRKRNVRDAAAAALRPPPKRLATPQEASLAFRKRVESLGGTVESRWLGAGAKNRVRCAAGHVREVWPPHIMKGVPLCSICTGRASSEVERHFREEVERQGAVVLEPRYLGVAKPHLIRCAKGHEGNPRPTHVTRGGGVCATCAGADHDVFYVVSNALKSRVKFGITSGDPESRLGVHRRNGYKTVVRLLEGMARPRNLEQGVVRALHDAGHRPVCGREYFDLCALGLVLDIVDHYPIEWRESSTQAS